jgi:hypothetical protein
MTSTELDRAAEHVGYEISTLVGQALELADRSVGDAVSMALIEASLVHIRLLDEFFTTAKKPDQFPKQLIARDWLPNWTCVHVIDKTDRIEIGARLAHMSAERDIARGWQLMKMTDDCCRIGGQFIDELERTDADRAKPLLWCLSVFDEWADWKAQQATGVYDVASTTSSSTLWWPTT